MASSSKSKKIYDVFLSFRGAELRNNFVSHLYQALHRIGIYTFLDSEELKKGDKILMLMKAIEESRIAIIVFSKDYASSKWCLKEVAKIMECKEQNNLTVLPVFYKVEPREVRGGKESYERALTEHESKFGKDSEEVKIWKKVLSEARSLSGWHLNDENESELIQRIVKEISTRLNQTPLHVAKHPTGIDSQVVKLKLMLHLESNDDVVMVGLWGQGGIGKSTLARALYNAIFRQFEGSCLLANVREAQNFKDLISLQETLLLEILSLQQKLEVSSVERGINLIQRRLCHKKVLLILDDVDDLSQLNALAGEDKWFGNGSRIIVTTRDNHLLTYLGIDQDHVYEVRELNNNDARELFSKHAFPTHQDSGIRTDLVDSVLNHAKGLPLALEVLGSFLRGRTKNEWESALDDISTAPKKEINDLLKISYDGLQPRVKEIFLHIACFFKGWDSEYVKKVLDSCDLKAIIGLNILMERSLIRSEYGKLQMHDLIQLMGMDIVNQQSDDPRRRSRLWRYDDVVDVLSSDMVRLANTIKFCSLSFGL
ncbi:TMV resistance protein N isoform X5 [Eucalyptus grandis]|uniref:TMV resistance protein N isoform X5 n=1 Tax=Eucalyptus grandis TaxID=71139 RepID=UPI00192E8BC0|nr:TMV resistance protein N isoform X5 [Eucalyptus grandis]